MRTHTNLLVTMLLGGLWHGASWLFVIWGGLHGVYLIVESLTCRLPLARWALWKRPAGQWFIAMITFLCVTLAWVFFRAETLTDALVMCRAMVGASGMPPHTLPRTVVAMESLDLGITTALAAVTLAIHWRLRYSSIEDLFARMPALLRSLAIAGMAYLVFIEMSGGNGAFIYFQF